MLLVMVACDRPPPEGAVAVPCGGNEATVLELGSPYRLSGSYAEFDAIGGTVWVAGFGFSDNGLFEPEVGLTGIELGWAANPPRYDSGTGEASAEIQAEVFVKEGFWSPLELEAGNYWLWSTKAIEISIQTCEPGAVFDPVPASAPN